MSDLGEEELREAFEYFDKNGNGTLCMKEIEELARLCNSNPTRTEIKEFMTEWDKNGDSQLCFNEFYDFMKNQSSPEDQKQQLLEAFKIYDKDGNGHIDRVELKEILCDDEEINNEYVEEIFSKFDSNQDGALDYEEFIQMMTNPVSPPGKE